MLTAVRFMLDTRSGWIVPIFLVIVGAVFAGFWFLSWENRTRKGLVKLLLSFAGAGLVCEIAWSRMFYPGGTYLNLGLGDTLMGLLFWPVSLLFLGMIVKEVK